MLLRRLVLAAAALLLAVPAAAQQKTTVILVRHAEKAVEGGSDPAISEAGQLRARALAAELADDSVDAVLVTRFVRTQQTAAPAATARGVTPQVVPVEGGAEAHAAAVREAVMAHAGHTVLIVGHSNTVPALVAALGGPAGIAIAEPEFGNLFTLVLEEGKPAVFTRACYGARDPSGHCAAVPGPM
jgi:broad specificity phosphatase PhoE